MVRKAALAIALVAAPPAVADTPDYFSTGNGLLQSCTNESDRFAYPLCLGYISGAVQQLQLLQMLQPKQFACIPTGVTNGQIVDVVVKYLRDHPENRQWSASFFVTNALVTAWPCAKK